MKQTLKTLSPLLVVFAVLLSSSFIDAAWIAPSGSPSAGNNAPAPINVSAQNQIKSGAITAYDLNAGRFMRAGSQMRSPQYCDQNGANCFTAAQATAPSPSRAPYTYHRIWTETWGQSDIAWQRCRENGHDGFFSGMDNDKGWEVIYCFRNR